MGPPELATVINRTIEDALSRFPQWKFARIVVEEDVSDGVPKAFYASKANGLQIGCDSKGIVNVIFVYSVGREGFEGYRHPVAGVELSWDRRKVRTHLGTPSWTVVATTILGLGNYGRADRYDYPSHSIHFQFHHVEPHVELITVMAPKTVWK